MSYFEFPHTRTYDGDLGVIIKKIEELLKCCDVMTAWKKEHEKQYEELKQLYDDIMAGRFPDSIVAAFQKWMEDNALDLVGQLVKCVWFGLSDAGYYVAYIPDSWSDIDFYTTGLDVEIPIQPEYGHLVLAY